MPYGKTNLEKVREELRKLRADPELWSSGPSVVLDEVRWIDRDRVDPGDIDELVESIKEVGLIEPILVEPDGTGVCGWRRWKACSKLGWEYIPAQQVSLDAFTQVPDYRKRAELIENAIRKDLTPREAARRVMRYLEEEKRLARERQREGGRRGGSSAEASCNLQEASRGESLERACTRVGRRATTMRKVLAAYNAQDEHPDILEQMEKKGWNKIDGPYKELRRRQQIERARDVPLPAGRFHTIVMDPPWDIPKLYVSDGEDPVLDYPTMTIKEIEEKVGAYLEECAEKDGCHIYLWVTHGMLPEAFKLLEAWGVQYRSRLLSWEKVDEQGRSRGGNPAMSFMPTTEFVLFGGIGSLPLDKIAIPTHFRGLRREHSRKPDEFYKIVMQASPGPYLDMFGRGGHGPDWTTWGLEATKFDEEPVPALD